jgi:cysteine-rich repeat protein
MSSSARSVVAVCWLVAAVAPAVPAPADIDATGAWLIASDDLFAASSHWVQTGSSLSADLSVFGAFAGTIDPVTGSFSLSAPSACPLVPFNALGGTIAPDGRTLTATLDSRDLTLDCCLFGCTFALTGTRCGGGTLDPGEQCDDGNNQSGDGCDAQCQIEACFLCSGEPSLCTPGPPGTPCDDGNLCTANACDGSGVCVLTGPVACDDGSACTVDSCDPLLGCLHAPDVRACRSAQTTRLRVTTTAANKLVWKWRKGQSTSQSEFADPRASATYTFCLFAGTSAAVAVAADIPADAAKWAALGSVGFRYRDTSAAANGIQRVVLRGSDAERARIVFRGKGAGLSLTPPPLDLPLTAQLTNHDTDVCWGATYDAGGVVRNQAGVLRARSSTP